MCTVTYIRSGSQIYLTSSRDEQESRSKAQLPAVQALDKDHSLLFPKDPDGGGSWIALKNNGDAAVLLNGAFIQHKPKPPYRQSRGLVLLQTISAAAPLQHFSAMELCRIEPFTMLLFTAHKLHECRWDGVQKHVVELNPDGAYIWSSVTLYNREVQMARQTWFDDWLRQKGEPAGEDILQFHRNGGAEQASVHLALFRESGIKTVSITSVAISEREACLTYLDSASGVQTKQTLSLTTNLFSKAETYG